MEVNDGRSSRISGTSKIGTLVMCSILEGGFLNIGSIFLPLLIATPLIAQIAGTWKLESRPDLPALIEKATANLKPVDRIKARSRLNKINTAYPVITITRSDHQIRITYGTWNPLSMPDNAMAVPWTRDDGEKFLISAHMEGDSLIQTFMAEDGMLKNIFHVHHNVLTMLVTVRAFDLPKPFKYTLNYRL